VANHRQGDAPRAVALLEESLSLFGEVGDRRSAALAALNLADALRDRGDLTHAAIRYREALVEFAAMGDRALVAAGLMGLGSVMVRQGEFQLAATLLGAASALTSDEGLDSGAASPELATPAADLDAIRDALGEDAFTAAWDAGRARSLEAAVQVALSDRP
jgi:Tetratricopeptide repeat